MNYNRYLTTVVAVLLLGAFCTLLDRVEADTDEHSHKKDENKERVSDGATPHQTRFAQSHDKHYQDGEHHTEFDHEAVLGNRETAEEYDHLPPQEAKKRLAVLAHAMDVNNDNTVDKEELAQWIYNSFKMLNSEESRERHDESDVDGDGYVTWEEYVSENYGGNLDEDPNAQLEEKKMMAEDKELFTVADLNGDGMLSTEEFLDFSHPGETSASSDVLLKRAMEDKDLDRDGYLSLEEYIGDIDQSKDKENYITEKDRFEQDYDRDQDGKLSPEEVKLWILPDDRESADQEAEHLIANSDNNRDRSLSIEEIIDNHDNFVGSEATDYGQHLHELHKFTDEL